MYGAPLSADEYFLNKELWKAKRSIEKQSLDAIRVQAGPGQGQGPAKN